jgi:hypothetical protein
LKKIAITINEGCFFHSIWADSQEFLLDNISEYAVTETKQAIPWAPAEPFIAQNENEGVTMQRIAKAPGLVSGLGVGGSAPRRVPASLCTGDCLKISGIFLAHVCVSFQR